MSETRQEVPWAEGRRAWVMDVDERLLEGVGERHPNTGEAGWRCGVIWLKHLAFSPARLLPGQCPDCFEVGTHAPDCARGKRIAENLAKRVWAWIAPFVMQSPPTDDVAEVEVFQVYRHGLSQMVNLANLGDKPDWRCNGVDSGEDDRPDPCAVGWVALGPEGPTCAPWGL